MHIVIAGGSGLIGSHLIKALLKDKHTITLITRDVSSGRANFPSVMVIDWTQINLQSAMKSADAVINLSGASIGHGQWTKTRKETLRNSRLDTTLSLVEAITATDTPPKTFLQASACGYYGTDSTLALTESSLPGNDFLANLCVDWEMATDGLRSFDLRLVLMRTSIVLAKDQGTLPLLVKSVKSFMGGKSGSGDQWLPWIHIEDEVGAILHCLYNNQVIGPVNMSAPHPLSNEAFMAQLRRSLHHKLYMNVPSFLLKTTMGEMSMLILEGQKIIPTKLLDTGFVFKYPSLSSALEDLI